MKRLAKLHLNKLTGHSGRTKPVRLHGSCAMSHPGINGRIVRVRPVRMLIEVMSSGSFDW